MREIALDTETTGFDALKGDRIVEIGCVELFNHLPTGEVFHRYLNPERDMPEEAFKVHGLSAQFLADKPLFSAVAADFIAFIGDSPLVIHNAEFDMRFLNAELARLSLPTLPMSRSIDTVAMARKRFPGAQANLDALCRRFEIDNTHRTRHGALLDAELLADLVLAGRHFHRIHGDLGVFTLHNDCLTAADAQTKDAYRADQARLFSKLMNRPLRPADRVGRRLAWLARWLGDPAGLAIRLRQVVDRHQALPLWPPP